MLHQDGADKKEKVKTKGVNSEGGLRDDTQDAVQKVGGAAGRSVGARPAAVPPRWALPQPEGPQSANSPPSLAGFQP